MDGKFGNVISDTVVDTQITHPTEMDFYLCSHSSIQDASRQTKYHRIWDENYLTEDQLEQLTFYLCFMFARCTRAITYPAPSGVTIIFITGAIIDVTHPPTYKYPVIFLYI